MLTIHPMWFAVLAITCGFLAFTTSLLGFGIASIAWAIVYLLQS